MARRMRARLGPMVAVLAALAVGCASGNARYFAWDQVRQLKAGMSEADVRAVMGPPSRVSGEDDRRCWFRTYTSRWDGQPRHASVRFIDGKVEAVSNVESQW